MAETTEQYRNRINQLKTDIENEPYIKKMRENIAEGISTTGGRQADIEVRQDTLEDDFVAVQQDASSASPSGAEVAVARAGFNTLDERLTTKEQEVNAQLAQTNYEKASTAYVNQLVSSLSENGPYDAVTTLAALWAKYPDGAPGPILVFENNHSYIWSEGTWKDFGVYQGIEIKPKTITPDKTTFVMESENLFNKDSSGNIDGKFLNFAVTPPSQATNAEALISHQIKVKPGQKFSSIFDTTFFGTVNARAALYDSTGTYIDTVTPSMTGQIGTITMPTVYPNLDHFRINVKKSVKGSLMIVEGPTYPDIYLPYPAMLSEEFTLNNRQTAVVDSRIKSASFLFGKTAEGVGDSIYYGAGDSGRGWLYRIALNNGGTQINRAVAGAVFARGVKTSAGADVPSILDQIAAMSGSAHYNLFEGGTNDADYNVPMGEITTGFNATLDENTFCGAFESACKQMITKCYGKKIGYIVAQKMGTVSWQNKRYPYFAKAMEICRKWGIPYLNLWDDFYLNPSIDVLNSIYYTDTQHLTPLGYDLTAPVVESWMRTL